MHPVLHLPEILYNIFGHLAPSSQHWEWVYDRTRYTRDLAVLARTCQAFKEPALDVLWSEILDLSTLALCIPHTLHSPKPYEYTFKGPLTDADWATVRSYGRRVWVFRNCSLRKVWLNEESIEMLYGGNGDRLFPNLRFLSWPNGKPFPLHIAVEPLRRLKLDCRRTEISKYRNILDSVGILCPLMKVFELHMPRQSTELDNILSDHVLRWSNLETLYCPEVALTANAFLHVSRMSTLTELGLILRKEVPSQIFTPDLDIAFPSLLWCDISAGWFLPIAELFARIRLPAIKELSVRFPGTPSKLAFRSFVMALRSACSAHALTHLSILSQRSLRRRLTAFSDVHVVADTIGYDDLYPCTAFGHLRVFKLNLSHAVRLSDTDVLELVSAWPQLEELAINPDMGWRCPAPGPRGLTCMGLVRLLRACPMLRSVSLRLDTPTFVGVPEDTDVSYPARLLEHINVLDSPLEPVLFEGVVDMFVRMAFAPILLIGWVRTQMDARVLQTQRSWFRLDAMVKMRLKGIQEDLEADARGPDASSWTSPLV